VEESEETANDESSGKKANNWEQRKGWREEIKD
jgi:hypothetical protein